MEAEDFAIGTFIGFEGALNKTLGATSVAAMSRYTVLLSSRN